MRLPRKHTMKQRADFVKVRETGSSKAGRFLLLSTLEDNTLPHTMFAFITTRKVGKAHDRNLMRRRFRAVLHECAPHFIHPLRYIVTVARHNTSTASFAELRKDWIKQAVRLGILKDSHALLHKPAPTVI